LALLLAIVLVVPGLGPHLQRLDQLVQVRHRDLAVVVGVELLEQLLELLASGRFLRSMLSMAS